MKPVLEKIKRADSRQLGIIIAGALIYAGMFAVGNQMEKIGGVSLVGTLMRIILVLPIFALFIGACFTWMPTDIISKKKKNSNFHFFAAFVCIIIAWIPFFLIYYPGSLQYDNSMQVLQITYNAYNQTHPLLHTLYFGLCLSLLDTVGSIEICCAIYSISQMVVMAMCFSYVCTVLSGIHTTRVAVIATIYYMLYPLHMAMASNATKDVLFSGCFSLMVVLLLKWSVFGQLAKKDEIILAVSSMFACMLRNNMIYALLVWWLLMLIVLRNRRLCLLIMLSMILARGCNYGLVRLVSAVPGDEREFFSVPVQQIARTYRDYPEDFTEEDIEYINELFYGESVTWYDSTISDPVKNNLNIDMVKADNLSFWRFWAKLGLSHIRSYLEAFFELTMPAWYPYTHYAVNASYVEVGLRSHAVAGELGLPDIVQPRRFSSLREWLNIHVFRTGADENPIFRWFFNIGLIMWISGLCILYSFYRRCHRRSACLMLPVLLLMTYLLGPVIQGRYAYPFICILPSLIAFVPDASVTADSSLSTK